MPSELRTRLEDGWRQLGLAPEAVTSDLLLEYLRLIDHWNRVYNLTAVRDQAQMVSHHLLDCAALIPLLNRHAPPGCRLLDVGSGGGLPGVVVAIVAPETQVTCVDAVDKKARFVQQVALELGLTNLRALHCRIEDVSEVYDVVTARAFSTLQHLTSLTRKHLMPSGIWLAMKGKLPDAELNQLGQDVRVFHVEQVTVPGLAADRCIVCMRPC